MSQCLEPYRQTPFLTSTQTLDERISNNGICLFRQTKVANELVDLNFKLFGKLESSKTSIMIQVTLDGKESVKPIFLKNDSIRAG